MAGITKRVSLGLVVALLGAMSASMLASTATLADTNLVIGQQAVISYANGDQVRLRETPDYEGTLIAMYDEGTYVTVLDGPVTDDAGNFWYQVSVDNLTGYIVADFLALDTGVPLQAVAEVTEEPTIEDTPTDVPIPDVPTETDPVAVVPTAPVSGAVIGIGWVAGTNGDGVRCRAAMDVNAPVITVLPEGTQVEITGPVTDIWQPINCMGGGGFVAAEFITSVDPNAAPVQAPATDGSTTTDGGTATNTPVASQTPVASETATSSETPVATDPAATGTAVPGESTQTPIAGETPVATETVVVDAPAQTEGDTTVLDYSLVSGAAIVTGTNGDGVRCRARASSGSNTITIVPEGTTVQLTGVATGVWQPVFCNGSAGFISNKFLGSADAPSSTDSGTVASTDGATTLAVGAEVSAAALSSSALVSGTNGDGVRCRSGASTSSSIIAVISEGTSVSLRGLASGGWQPVVCAGSNGWISTTYLSSSSTSGSSTTGGTDTSGSVSSTATTGSATVNSAPGGLNCRASASMSASVITVLSHGSTVSLRGSASNGWQPVTCAGQSGFVSAQYLTYGSTSGGSTSGGSTSGGSTSGGSTSGGTYTSGTTLYVSGTNGGGVRLRSSASTSGSILAIVAEGASVTVRSGSVTGWVAVTYSGTNGFISSDYLAKNSSGTSGGSTSGGSTSGGSTSGGSTSGGSGTGLVNGDHAATTDSLNLRYSASYSAGVAAVAPSGTVVLITGSVSNGFYPVTWDGLNGFMAGQYLTKTSAALSTRGGSGNSGSTNGGSTSGSTTGGATGNAIVDYAMRYLGYPYVWATHGPSSFDCSGFTYWVVLNVLGRDIGAGLWTQVSAGTAVSRSSLQPGDLVFFQNTYEAGLSHVGIYIGNDQFIHAENESTGVRISDLNSSYYSSRWYGAVRLS